MAKNYLTKTTKKYFDPYFAISNPLMSRAIPKETFAHLVARFFFRSPEKNFKARLSHLLENKTFRIELNVYADKIESFFTKPMYAERDTKCSWIAHTQIFKREHKRINNFIAQKEIYESALLIGDYIVAREALENCKLLCGESIWYVRSMLLLLNLENRKEEFETFSIECQERAENNVSRNIFKYLRIFYESKDAHYPLTTLLKRIILEFKEGNFDEGAACYSSLFVPYPILEPSDFEIPINYFNFYPLVDQYNFIIDFFKKSLVSNDEQTIENIKQFIGELKASIKDEQLIKLLDQTQQSELSADSNEIFLSYAKGNYSKVIEAFDNNLNKLPNPFIFINIVAKSLAILNIKQVPEKNITYQIINSFIPLYDTSKPQKLVETSILSLLIKLNGFKLFTHLQSALYFALPNKYSCSEIKKSSQLTYITPSEINPIVINYANGKASRFCTSLNMNVNEYDRTHKLKLEISELIESQHEEELITTKLNELKKLIILKKDFIELHCEFCLKFKKYDFLISESAEALIENPELLYSIPLSSIVDVIKNNQIISLASVYLVYFYNKHISNKKEEVLNELFEDFLISNEVEKPSELLTNKTHLSPLDLVFFTDICSVETMDYLTIFQSSAELLRERVEILDGLLEKQHIDQERRLQEVELIVSEFLIEKTSKKLNQAKINVNEIAIIKNNQDHIQSLINQFHEPMIEEDNKSVSLLTEPKISYLTGTKNGIVVNINKILKDSFINDDKYGLDKNLSTEIRHGFFSDFIRAKFIEKNLLTEVNDNNEFEENKYWREKHSMINPHILDEVDEALKEFSRGLNVLIGEAEEWMKVSYSSDQKNRFFDYANTDLDHVNKIKKMISSRATTVEVSAFVMRTIWERTEAILNKLREKINNEFRTKIDQLLDTLINQIDRSKRGTSMKELTEAIAQAKNEVKEVITTVAEWFRRANTEFEQHSLNQVLEISIKTFKSIKGTPLQLNVEIDNEFSNIEINGHHIKPYAIAIFNLLDNAIRHSGLGKITQVDMQGILENDLPTIIISNNISEDKAKILTASYLENIRDRLESTNSTNLVKKEGGSGLVKAKNELKLISDKTNVSIDRINETFTVRIACGK